MTVRPLRLGTRGSALAQARSVARRLEGLGARVELVRIETRGDPDVTNRFADLGSFGIFARELQRALLEGRVDLAVHSHKDLPTQNPAGLVVAAVPERVDPRDVLLVRGAALAPERGSLPLASGARVGTASARRTALLGHLRPDLEPVHPRGNVPTRLAKLAAGEAEAILLAAAGLERLGIAAERGEFEALDLAGIVVRPLDPRIFVPAPAQGALAIEARADDKEILALLAELDDPAAARCLAAERGVLAALEGGCPLALGAWCRPVADSVDGNGQLELRVALGTPAGLVRRRLTGADPKTLAELALAEFETGATESPLGGLRVLLTRAAEDNERWGAELEELGARVRAVTCLCTAPRAEARQDFVAAMPGARWLALASRRGVDAVHHLGPALPPRAPDRRRRSGHGPRGGGALGPLRPGGPRGHGRIPRRRVGALGRGPGAGRRRRRRAPGRRSGPDHRRSRGPAGGGLRPPAPWAPGDPRGPRSHRRGGAREPLRRGGLWGPGAAPGRSFARGPGPDHRGRLPRGRPGSPTGSPWPRPRGGGGGPRGPGRRAVRPRPRGASETQRRSSMGTNFSTQKIAEKAPTTTEMPMLNSNTASR